MCEVLQRGEQMRSPSYGVLRNLCLTVLLGEGALVPQHRVYTTYLAISKQAEQKKPPKPRRHGLERLL